MIEFPKIREIPDCLDCIIILDIMAFTVSGVNIFCVELSRAWSNIFCLDFVLREDEIKLYWGKILEFQNFASKKKLEENFDDNDDQNLIIF